MKGTLFLLFVPLFSVVPALAWTQSWSDQPIIISPPEAIPNGFGTSMALDGTHLVVSAPDASNNIVQGVVYVFGRHEGGLDQWGLVQIIRPSEEQRGEFGATLALSYDQLFIGSRQGTWIYEWNVSEGRFEFDRQIGELRSSSIQVTDSLLVIASAAGAAQNGGVLGSFDGLATVFSRDPEEPSNWTQYDLVIAPADPLATLFSCAGKSVALGQGFLALGDPCYTETLTSAYCKVGVVPWEGNGFSNSVFTTLPVDVVNIGAGFGRCIAALHDTLFMVLPQRNGGIGGWIHCIRYTSTTEEVQIVQLDTLFNPYAQPGYWASAFSSIEVDRYGQVYASTGDWLLRYRPDPINGGWDEGERIIQLSCGASEMLLTDEHLIVGCPGAGSGHGQVEIYTNTSVGVPQVPARSTSLRISPNPFHEQAQVVLTPHPHGPVLMEVFDVSGRPVLSKITSTNGTFELFNNGLVPGQYALRLSDPIDLDRYGVARFVIE